MHLDNDGTVPADIVASMENVTLNLKLDGTYELTLQSIGTEGEWDASGTTVWLKPKRVMGQPISRLDGPAKVFGEPVGLTLEANSLVFGAQIPRWKGVKLARTK